MIKTRFLLQNRLMHYHKIIIFDEFYKYANVCNNSGGSSQSEV